MRRLCGFTRHLTGGERPRLQPGEYQALIRTIEKQKPGTFLEAVLSFNDEYRRFRQKPHAKPRREKRPFWWHPPGCACRKCVRAGGNDGDV